MTVDALAQELGISSSTLRIWLRKHHPRDPSERGKPWTLTEEHVAAARERFQTIEPATAAVAVTEDPPAVVDEPPPGTSRFRRPGQPEPLWLDDVGGGQEFRRAKLPARLKRDQAPRPRRQ